MKTRIIDGVEVHSSSGNVYADLGLADAELLKIKTVLVIEIVHGLACLHMKMDHWLELILFTSR